MNRIASVLSILFVAAIVVCSAHGQDRPSQDVKQRVDMDGDIPMIEQMWQRPLPVGLENDVVNTHQLLFSSFASTDQAPEGDMPRELAITPDGNTVLVVNRDTGNISFMDVDAGTITDSVNVGSFPVDIAVSPDGQYAVVPNVFSHSVSVIDIEDRTVTDVAVSGEQPFSVVVTSDSQTAVVGVINDAVTSAISVIDLTTKLETNSIPTIPQGSIGFFGTPESGISGNIFSRSALASDSTVIIPDRGNDQVAFYDLTTGSETIVPTADAPSSVDVSPDGSFAIVGHEGTTPQVSVFDLNNLTLTNEIASPVSLNNQIIRVTPDGQYAMASILNAVLFLNLTNGTSSQISTGTVGDIEFSFDDQFAFVANFNARVIDLATRTLVDTIPFAASYESVTSPTEYRAFSLNNRFREDIHAYNINGAAGFFLGRIATGEPFEGDATRTMAMTPDGQRIVACNIVSDNAAIINACNGQIEAYVPTGERSWGVAVTPDGTTAVVCNLESNTVSIIDVDSGTKLTDLVVAQRPTEVAISPDSQMAYVTSVQGTDRIHFIALDGANSNVVGSIISGQMGTIIHTFNVASGISVSPDNSVVAACISFDDELLLIDTTTLTEITRVPVGDFPIRASFSSDSQFVYVSNRIGNTISKVEINGAASQVVDTIAGVTAPLDIALSADDNFGFVGNFDFNSPSLRVFDTSNGNIVQTIPLNDSPRRVIHSDSTPELFVATTGGELIQFNANGASTSIIESLELTSAPSDMAYSEATKIAAIALPIFDGVDLVSDVLFGDINLDGEVTLLDVAPFVTLISTSTFQAEADINKDGIVDLLDVNPFVDLLGS